MADYVINRTDPTVYLDKSGKAVNGYRVEVFFPEFDEVHNVSVPDLNPTNVQASIKKLLDQRKALASLGSDEE